MKAPVGVALFLANQPGQAVRSVTCEVWLDLDGELTIELATLGGGAWEASDDPIARQHADDALRLAGYAGPDRLYKP